VSARPARSGFFPLDEELGLLPGQLTPRLQEGLVRLSTHMPSFAKAATELAFFTQTEVHRTTARRLTEATGAAAVAVYDAAVSQIAQTYPPSPPGPDTLIFSVDGAMIPLVHGQWAEVRTLAVGSVAPPVERDGERVITTQDLSYFSRLTDSSSFGQLALGELHRRGIERAGRVGAVVDGAEWCQTVIDLHYPEAVRILDFSHAAGYLLAIGQTEGPAGALLSEAARAGLLERFKQTDPSGVLQELRDLVADHPQLPELTKLLAYLDKREAQMQYPTFQAAGWPIGSGSVESANKLVVEERLKGPGMHWADGNVNPMLALRNAFCNDRWNEVWGQIEAELRRQGQERRAGRHHQRHGADVARPAVEALPAAPRSDVMPCDRVAEPAVRSEQHGDAPVARPAANHPWRTAWSVRRQRELVAAA
jgi:hypothetical protein